MANASLLKGGVMVVLLLAALAFFDAFSNYASNQITGAQVGEGESGLSVDLSNYPSFFTDGENFNALIVVGDQASSSDALAAVDVSVGVEEYVGATSSISKASEVADTFAQNVISVGTGCVNAVTNDIQLKFGQISGTKCWNGALSGEGVGAITLYDFGNGKVGMVVEGYTDNDVRRAAKVLKSYKDWQASGYLTGKGVLVEATSEGGTRLGGYGWATATDQTACTDSDGGVDYKVKGFMKAGDADAGQWDACLNSNELVEYYCDNNQGGKKTTYYCQNGCKDGACVPLEVPKAASVAIKAGWNIIGANTTQALVSTTCGRNQIDDTIWAYYPQANKYGRYNLSSDLKRIESAGDEESDNLRNTYQGTLSATGAFWLYNRGEACTMASSLAPLTGGFAIADGWNMLAVQTNWQGKKLSDLLGSCNFRIGYFFDPATGWAPISLGTVFEAERVGKGFWMYATSCTFKALFAT